MFFITKNLFKVELMPCDTIIYFVFFAIFLAITQALLNITILSFIKFSLDDNCYISQTKDEKEEAELKFTNLQKSLREENSLLQTKLVSYVMMKTL